ncbi:MULTISPECIES: UTP--glucose-1-phosphate uridylyltransferase [Collinsella]|uniref:UTP--glucose-1-phosphate uridylyltransferase n=1 Tax=Collinsella TaxID=102106 RepID=UPI000B37FB89|nr:MULTISPECIES: UTP--glucose-1-phosphate uridylyltransferase [Collinsella]MBM6942840.1 UTP--glucose-1-phosphate uridylyltransferase [Collinsella intestinalis]OUO63639.1 nucleotidyltransferase [Collinsella sp. An268]
MKAIIPAAGLGTRFLPSTKCTPKEMLPVLDKPVIQYVVEEALEPDEVTDAIIVTSPNKPELLNYFQPDLSLEQLLRARGKDAYAGAVAEAGGLPVDFRFQYKPKGLGHAIRSAADAVAGESFLVLLGDYVVPNRDICDKMLEVSCAHGGASVIAVAPCAPEEVSRYGVIAGDRAGSLAGAEGVADEEPGAVWRVSGLVEKPDAADAPSNLYIVGRYLLSPLVMDLLEDQAPGAGGEVQLTDAMARSLDREAMYAVVIDPLSGYDTGTPSGWMATNALMAAADPRFSQGFWDAIDERGGLKR